MPESLEDGPKEKKTALKIIKDWFSNSPSHGIRRISQANSVVERLFWSIIVLIFTSLMALFILTVFKNYNAQPTKINLTVRQYQDPAYFPAITFCNLNPLRNIKDLIKDHNRNSRSNDPDSDRRNHLHEYVNKHLTDKVQQKHPTMSKLGYTLDDLLIQCTFNGHLCHRNLTPFFHPNYGNCFTFDSDLHVSNVQQNSTPQLWDIDEGSGDEGYQLFLELFLHQNEYIPFLDDRAAFRLFIHRKQEIPLLSQNSLFLAPKTYTKLIFSQRVIEFSQHCRKELTNDMREFLGPTTVRYTQALCLKLCHFRAIQKECECLDQFFMVFFQFFERNQTKQVNTSRPCAIGKKCNPHLHRPNSMEQCPQCLPECELIQYTIQSSYADYPNSRAANKVSERIEIFLKNTSGTSHRNKSACNDERNQNYLSDLVAVGISASPHATEILSESPMYTWVDLISSIGGQTGLWIGVSLISFVELAELFFLLLRHLVTVVYNRISNR